MLLRRIPPGASMGWYRIVYFDWMTQTKVAAPIGLHWLVMAAHWLNQQTYRYLWTKWDQRMLDVREAGRQDGIRQGIEQERRRWQADPMGTMLRQWREDADRSKAEKGRGDE